MDFKRLIVDYVDPFIKSTGPFLLVVYGFGFLVWNTYLSRFGFFESSFLQTRFISAGLFFLLVFFIPCYVILRLYLYCTDKKLIPKRLKPLVFFCFGIIFGLFTTYYSWVIFPKIPQTFGGARPFAKSIIADSSQIDFLADLNLVSTPNGENKKSIQTAFYCEIYSNNDLIIAGVAAGYNARILSLYTNQFKGFQFTLPSQQNDIQKYVCDFFIPKSIFDNIIK